MAPDLVHAPGPSGNLHHHRPASAGVLAAVARSGKRPIEPAHIFVPLIGLLAFFLKGTTGTGTSIVIVSLSSLVIEPKSTIILASFVNVFGGLTMLRIDPVPLRRAYWVPIAVAMAAGSVLGALTLKIVLARSFDIILGGVFLATGLWFVIRKGASVPSHGPGPDRAGTADVAVGTFAGFCGGFIGVNAPPLILHFGRALNKARLRRLLVVIFIPAAVAQTAVFIATGQLTPTILLLGILVLPPMLAGIHLGNRVFLSISETAFKRILGILLILISLKLVLGAIV